MKKILIIEDDLSLAEIERDFLINNGYAVEMITDGKKGLDEAMTGQYSLILLDVELRGIDGFEICKKIWDRFDVPIIVVTAFIAEWDKTRIFELGVTDCIIKPFSPTELVERVNAAI